MLSQQRSFPLTRDLPKAVVVLRHNNRFNKQQTTQAGGGRERENSSLKLTWMIRGSWVGVPRQLAAFLERIYLPKYGLLVSIQGEVRQKCSFCLYRRTLI